MITSLMITSLMITRKVWAADRTPRHLGPFSAPSGCQVEQLPVVSSRCQPLHPERQSVSPWLSWDRHGTQVQQVRHIGEPAQPVVDPDRILGDLGERRVGSSHRQ
jgi:hypothetical protein